MLRGQWLKIVRLGHVTSSYGEVGLNIRLHLKEQAIRSEVDVEGFVLPPQSDLLRVQNSRLLSYEHLRDPYTLVASAESTRIKEVRE